jgi:branched-chain amino acid transport system ATP-binding protein
MSALLEVHDLHAWYGESHILQGIHFSAHEGTLTSLLGRNGAGRSTTFRALFGLTTRRTGSIKIAGQETIHLSTHQIAPLGVGWCPEERAIFSTLSVEENLMLPPQVAAQGMSTEEIYTLFPQLEMRKKSPGTCLSGGEQQMLALARILRTGARLLLLDEITEGLAPVIVQKLQFTLDLLKQRGYTIVLAEQNLQVASELADQIVLIEHGKAIMHVLATEFSHRRVELETKLGV